MSKLVRKLRKAIQDKLNPDGSQSNEEDLPLEYDADDLRETIKSFQESPPEEPSPPPESAQLWKTIGNANRRVEEQIQREETNKQYWLDQIRELLDKVQAAEEENDERKIMQYLGLLKEFASRTKNSSLEKYVDDKQRDLFSKKL